MTFNSPLRYPGGKSKLAKFVASVCDLNNIADHYIEPYAGGASIALHLLFNGHVKRVTINDLNLSLYAFWNSILNHAEKFCALIENTEIDVKNWKQLKGTQKNKNR